MSEKLINIGKVVSAHGVKGEVKVWPHSDFLERCYRLRTVRIEDSGDTRIYRVEKVRLHGNMWIIKFQDTDSREEASRLKGCRLYIMPEEREPLPPGHYYYDDIEGLQVYDLEGNYLGKVNEVIPGGGHDIYSVKRVDGGKDPLLVPATKNIVRKIDTEEGHLEVDLPEGLTDL